MEEKELSIIASERHRDWLKDLSFGLKTNLCHWPENSRIDSIKGTAKLTYQLWVFKLVHESLDCDQVEKGWHLKQGSTYSASVFANVKGEYWTGWWEPQKIKEKPPGYIGPLCDFFEGKVLWKRPDLIFSKGNYSKLTDPLSFDILIECKNFEFNEWWKGGKVIDDELKPYKQLFKPKLFILASLKPIHGWAKKVIENEGINVVDKLYVGGEGIGEFIKILTTHFN